MMKKSSTTALLLAAALTCAVSVPARAERGRAAALDALISRFPDPNPRATPGSFDWVDGLSNQLPRCLYSPGEMAGIEQLVRLFDKYQIPGNGEGGYKDRLKAEIHELPNFSNRSDPQQSSNYRRLCMGIDWAPGITYRSLVGLDCRLMLRTHFDKGGTRAQLRDVVRRSRAELEAAPVPRP